MKIMWTRLGLKPTETHTQPNWVLLLLSLLLISFYYYKLQVYNSIWRYNGGIRLPPWRAKKVFLWILSRFFHVFSHIKYQVLARVRTLSTQDKEKNILLSLLIVFTLSLPKIPKLILALKGFWEITPLSKRLLSVSSDLRKFFQVL